MRKLLVLEVVLEGHQFSVVFCTLADFHCDTTKSVKDWQHDALETLTLKHTLISSRTCHAAVCAHAPRKECMIRRGCGRSAWVDVDVEGVHGT